MIKKNNKGSVSIDNEVLTKVAGLATIECVGVVGMAMVNLTTGLTKLLTRNSLARGVELKVKDNEIELDIHIIIEYGVNIKAVTDNLISSVKYKLERFSGMEIIRIDIYVEGVRVDE